MSTTASLGDPPPVDDAPALALGVLVDVGPSASLALHGAPLASHARHRLVDARVEVLPTRTSWASVVARDLPLVLHDPLCPLTPAEFLVFAVASASSTVVAGSRPVTDTIKTMRAERVGGTVDRDSLVAVTSPVVLPAALVAALDEWPAVEDLVGLVDDLRSRHPVTFLEAPSLGRRVEDESAVLLLEAYDELHPGVTS